MEQQEILQDFILMSAELQFGYFNFKGRGQISRLLLAYTKTAYKDVKYSFSNIAEWIQKDKQSLDLDFPSLPYLIDGRLKLTESRAIQQYIIHRAEITDLLGRNNKQKAFINNIEGVLRDVFGQLIKLYLSSRFLQQRKQTLEAISQKLDYLNATIGTKKQFLSRLTYVDFVATVVFEYMRIFFPHQYKSWPNIDKLTNHVNLLPQIIAYYSSSQAVLDKIAAQSARDPKFFGLKALYSKQKTQSSVQNQSKSSQIQIISRKIENQAKLSSQLETQHLEMTSQSGTMPSTFIQESVQIVQKQDKNRLEILQKSSPNHSGQLQQQDKLKPGREQRLIERQQLQLQQQQVSGSITQRKTFTSRVQQYMQAAQAANKNGVPQIKNQSQKKLTLTFSNIDVQSRINSKNEASWQANGVQQNKTPIPSAQISICLGYWGIRGLAQIQRHLLQYCELKFSEKIYQGSQEWFHGDKLALNLPLPNLPYLIQGDFKITESLAIDRYIIRCSQKKELLGRNLKDETRIQNFVKILSDLFKQLRVLCFTQDLEKTKAQQLLQKYRPVLERMREFIQNQQHAFGYLTWTDFYIAQVSYYIEKIFPEAYAKYDFFRNIRNSVLADSEIKKYYQRNGAIKGPFMPPSAKIIF